MANSVGKWPSPIDRVGWHFSANGMIAILPILPVGFVKWFAFRVKNGTKVIEISLCRRSGRIGGRNADVTLREGDFDSSQFECLVYRHVSGISALIKPLGFHPETNANINAAVAKAVNTNQGRPLNTEPRDITESLLYDLNSGFGVGVIGNTNRQSLRGDWTNL